MPPPTVENQNTSLLSTEENLQVFKLLGGRCQTIATTVVQLFTTLPPYHSQWIKRECGVLCFVRDANKKNYFFRLFSLAKNQMVWEHEMYHNMEYLESAPFFHVFEGEDTIIAFNFTSPQEAKQFRLAVTQKIEARKRKGERKAKQNSEHQSIKLPDRNFDIGVREEIRKDKKKKNKIAKSDISNPMGFTHIAHVGWDPITGFDVTSEGDQLKSLFEMAGITEEHIQDKETVKFIRTFLNTYQTTDVIAGPPVIPPRGPQKPVTRNPRPAPPPPPSDRAAPPEFNSPKKPRPPSPVQQANKVEAPMPPPPPPLPPPAPMGYDENTTAGPESYEYNDNDTKTDNESVKSPPVGNDLRSTLMDEIKRGINLTPAERGRPADGGKPAEVGSPQIETIETIADALKKALANRMHVLQHSDDERSDSDGWENDD